MTRLEPPPTQLDLATRFGATEGIAAQCFTVYVPNKDQADREIGTQRLWVLEAIHLLSDINGGATAIPVEGGWMNDDDTIILEHPVVIYSYVTDADKFLANLGRLREFLHRMGRQTHQGEIAFEFDGEFYRIRQFDANPEGGAS
jgi:hypothetical protein